MSTDPGPSIMGVGGRDEVRDHRGPLPSRHDIHRQDTLPSHSPEGQQHSAALSHTRSAARTTSSQSQDPEQPDAPRPPSPAPPEAPAAPPDEEVTILRLAAHYTSLVFGSMAGTLIRLGLDAMATYDGAVVFPLLWVQGVGCGIMGLASARKNELIAIYPPLVTFWTTGVAGSVTTFSSWMLEGFQAFSNFEGYSRKGFHDTVNGVAYSFATLLVSLACIRAGENVSSMLPALPTNLISHNGNPKAQQQPSPASSTDGGEKPRRRTAHRRSHTLDLLTIATAILSYLAALLIYFLAPDYWRHRASFPILLAPPGAILRFVLSKLNPKAPFHNRFPLGTFLANMIATLIIGGVYVAQLRPTSQGATLRCNALYSLEEGFCGCLSTVSTFVVEARSIRGWKWKWIYVLGSIILGHIFILAILGGVKWDKGLLPVCS